MTAGAFLATGGQTPGAEQRVGIVVATGWLAAVALAILAKEARLGHQSSSALTVHGRLDRYRTDHAEKLRG